MKRATSILNGKETAKKPWALRPDGDLWSIVNHIAEARNPKSIRLSWIKGHAGWMQIADGTVRAELAIGNGQADLAADFGHEVQGVATQQWVLDHHADKRRRHEQLIGRLQHLAIAIAKANISKRAENGFVNQGKYANIQWLTIPVEPLNRLDFTEGATLELITVSECRHSSIVGIGMCHGSSWSSGGGLSREDQRSLSVSLVSSRGLSSRFTLLSSLFSLLASLFTALFTTPKR